VFVHIAFNFSLLLVLPFIKYFQAPAKIFLPDAASPVSPLSYHHVSVLNERMLENPTQALLGLRREVMRMLNLVKMTAIPVMGIYSKYNHQQAMNIIQQDRYINEALDAIRTFVSAMPSNMMSREQNDKVRDLIVYAISLEQAGDIVVMYLVPRAEQMHKEDGAFSKNGNKELLAMHEQLLANLNLAANVLLTDDLESARLLQKEKTEMSYLERSSRYKHLKRLAEGTRESISSSDIHLDTLRSIRHLNSLISSVSYPILIENGHLLKSRLISGPNAPTPTTTKQQSNNESSISFD
jgi:phosphate:Na+ symporter